MAVGMVAGDEARTDRDIKAEFLCDLAADRGLQRLIALPLAPGELPEPPEHHVRRAFGDVGNPFRKRWQ
jgi:hypothetical protein